MFGSIPDIFGYFANLINVKLSYNNLTDSLPPSFAGSELDDEEKVWFVEMSEKKDEQGAEAHLQLDQGSEEKVVCWLLQCQ